MTERRVRRGEEEEEEEEKKKNLNVGQESVSLSEAPGATLVFYMEQIAPQI
jgi:hypothetical protein